MTNIDNNFIELIIINFHKLIFNYKFNLMKTQNYCNIDN